VQVGLAFIVLGGIANWRGKHRAGVVFAALGALLLMLGLIAPAVLAPVNRVWMALARAISKITQPVFLGIVYFVAFLPVGLVMRLFRRSAIARNRNSRTFWVLRPPGARRSSSSIPTLISILARLAPRQ
jgi:hypothetical protein